MKNGAEILNEVLELTGKTKNSLAKAINLKRSQNLYDIESGKVKNISSELSEKITLAFPHISREYLLTGEGNMILGKGESNNITISDSSKKQVHKKDLAIELIVDRAKITVLERYIAKLVADSLKIEVAQVLKMLDDDTQIEVAERLKLSS